MQNKKKYIVSIFLILTIIIAIGICIFKSQSITYNWHLGHVQSYQFYSRTITQTKKKTKHNTAIPNMMGQTLQGMLHVKFFEQTNNVVTMGLQFKPAEITINKKHIDEYMQILASPFFLEIAADGTFLNFHFSNTLAVQDEDLLKSIIAPLQNILIAHFSDSWNTQETDTLGTYASTYQMDKSIIKQKTLYESIHHHSYVPMDTISIKNHTSSFTVSETQSWLENVTSKELLSIKNQNGNLLKISNATSMTLMSKASEEAQQIFSSITNVAELIAKWNKLPKQEFSIAQQIKKSQIEKQLGSHNLKDYARTIFLTCKAFHGSCVNRFIDYLKLYPQSAAEVVHLLQDASISDDQAAMLINALQSAQTLPAQQALLDIINTSDIKNESRLQAMIAIGDILNPQASTINALWKMYEKPDKIDTIASKLSDNAALALGRISRTLSRGEDSHLDLASTINDKLYNELTHQSQTGKLTSIMYAAANSGADQFFQPLMDYTESDISREKAAAIQALSILDHEAIPDTYNKLLETESDPGVRTVLMQSITARNDGDLNIEAVCNQIRTEENEMVRGHMYRFLLKHRKESYVRKTLEYMMTIERTREHRNLISRALASRK